LKINSKLLPIEKSLNQLIQDLWKIGYDLNSLEIESGYTLKKMTKTKFPKFIDTNFGRVLINQKKEEY